MHDHLNKNNLKIIYLYQSAKIMNSRKSYQSQKPQIPALNKPYPKIKSILLVTPKIDSNQNYRQFRVKLKYPKTFCFDESTFDIHNSGTRSPWFLKLYRKTKNLQNFELVGAQTIRKGPIDKVLKRLPKVRSIKLQTFGSRSFQSCPSSGDRFDFIFKCLRRLNPSSLHVSMGSDFGIDNESLSYFVQSVFRYIQSLGDLKSLSLVLKKYTTIFGITPLEESSDFVAQQQKLFRSVSWQFKRIRKIEDLHLLFNASPQSILESFISSFDHLQKLRSIEVVSTNAEQGKYIIESLSRLRSLESVMLYNNFEPNDILSLVKNVPSLRCVALKDAWIFTNKTITPILSEINPKNVDIVKLHIDMPMNISTKEDEAFLVRFLSAFTKIQSLKIYAVCTNMKACSAISIAKQINQFTHLENLTLGLCMETALLASDFIALMKDLTHLKKFTLLTKLTFKEVLTTNWNEQIQTFFKVLADFVLQNKDLTELKMLWGSFNTQISGGMKEFVKKLDKLNIFELVFKPTFLNHGDGHITLIDSLTEMLLEMREINEVSIKNWCVPVHFKSCEKPMKQMLQKVEKNKNIKKISINSGASVDTLFFREELTIPLT